MGDDKVERMMMSQLEELDRVLRSLLHGKDTNVHLGFNGHTAYYESPADYYSNQPGAVPSWPSEEEKNKAFSENSVWTLQWYPRTPISFYLIAASSLPALIEFALKVDKEDA